MNLVVLKSYFIIFEFHIIVKITFKGKMLDYVSFLDFTIN